MPGIDPEVTCHSLNVDRSAKPVIQRARRPMLMHVEAVEEEVDRLLEARAIREVQYPTWLSNTVVVKKKNGKWRVCVDFTSLNKACPKDSFPLPKIDQLVDATSGHERMSFLDAYRGYHQIAMYPPDEEKTAFITPKGLYCYKVMPFGLKNAGATYQRLVTKMFKHLIGKTVEVYIDDMVVKTKKSEGHLADLKEVFDILKRYRLRLNASKCAFGVGSGIEASLDQIKAILELQSPTSAKQVQVLTGRAAALNRFISRSSDKCRPFFNLLPEDHKEAHKIRLKSARFSLTAEGHLYRRSFTGPLLSSTANLSKTFVQNSRSRIISQHQASSLSSLSSSSASASDSDPPSERLFFLFLGTSGTDLGQIKKKKKKKKENQEQWQRE
ncbi:hypothetical protein CsSME_00003142 [Camellia sinensis var. sinensis]